ncbi:TPA: hypothetical protein DDW35_05005 [Candidatus Sumerlaeota bacterium]|nr:hypothetical protein [Candidatus Sumerlaeota bacterium]
MDNDAKRWLQFFVVAALMMVAFNYLQPKRPLPATSKQRTVAQQTSATGDKTTSATQPTELSAATDQSKLPKPERLTPPEPVDDPAQDVVVETDICKVTFTTSGAYPTRWQIVDPKFARASQSDVEEHQKLTGRLDMKVGDPLPIEIIPNYSGLDKTRDYPLMVVLKETNGRYLDDFNRRTYQVSGLTSSTLATTANIVVNAETGAREVTFVSPESSEGLQLTKTYTFTPGSYLVQMRVTIANIRKNSPQNIDFSEPSQPGLGLMWGPGIGSTHYADATDASAYDVTAYNGTDISYKEFSSWEKVRSKGEAQEQDFSGSYKWAGIESRFYMSAIIPQTGAAPQVNARIKRQHIPNSATYTEKMAPPLTAEIYSAGFTLRPGDSKTLDYQVFVGPKKRDLLTDLDKKTNFDLSKVMFHNSYSLIRWLALFMLKLLSWFHAMTGNYGVAIILLTITMRLITQPFTHIAMKGQAKLTAEQNRVKPLIDAINEKYADDPQKKQAETWKTYREHGVNPLGAMKGCIWMLIQLPIFFALYRLLQMAIDLRGEHFLWIKDLTAPDALFSWSMSYALPFIGNKFNILPILMALSQMVAQQLQSSNIQDPNQKMMMKIMPIMFIFILYNFAAGLSLYWFVSNLWQITFQILMNKRVKEEAERKAHRAFEERRLAAEKGVPFPGKRPGAASATPGSWRDKVVAYIEAKAKEAQAQAEAQQKKKK